MTGGAASHASFHRTKLEPGDCDGVPDLRTAQADHLRWLRDKMAEVFRILWENPGWPRDDIADFEAYLRQREDTLTDVAAPGLIKRDQGLRDALGLLEPEPHVSALLDWELVEPGETIAEVADLFVMIYVAGLERLWPAFRNGYESEAGAIERRPQLEYYAMARTLIAFTWQGQDAARIDQALGLARRLVKGERLVAR